MSDLTKSLLAGLAQENRNPDSRDDGFAARAAAVADDDCLLLNDEDTAETDLEESWFSWGSSSKPAKPAGGPGFTGEITDKIGRKIHFVNGKRVKGAADQAPHSVQAKFKGEDVHVVEHDSKNGLVKIKTAGGAEQVVKVDDIDLGSDSDSPEQPPGAQTAPVKKSFGKSKATVSVRMGEAEVDEILTTQMFPGMDADAARQAVADVVGAPDDAEVFVYPDGDTIKVSLKHKDVKRCDRTISTDANGQKFIHNDYLEVKKPGSGLGMNIFARQVEQAAANGFAYIETTAGGSHENVGEDGKFKAGTLGGYYHWPNVGYDQSIDEITDATVVEKAKAQFPDAKTVRDVVCSQGGKKWWKHNGGEVGGMKFDLAEGSVSHAMLDAYMSKPKT